MKDSLDSVRSIYHLLVIVGTINLFFGVAQKYISDPYQFALDEIEGVEWELEGMQQKGEIAFSYDSSFFVFSQDLVKKAKTPLDILTKIEAMKNSNALPKKDKDSIEIFIQRNQEEVDELKMILSNKYKSDSVKLEDLVFCAKKFLRKDLFKIVEREHDEFRRFDHKYRSMRIPEVKRILNEKSDELRKSTDKEINILGIEISFIGMEMLLPILPSGILLYLFLLIRRINSMEKLKEDLKIIQTYPLILFFKDIFSISAVLVTLFLPCFSSNLIVAKAQSPSILGEVLFYAYPLINALLAIGISVNCELIRKQIYQNSVK